MIRKRYSIILLIFFSMMTGAGCSQVDFSKAKQHDQSSFSLPPTDTPPTETPTVVPPLLPSKANITYPSYAKVANIPYLYAQSEIFVNVQEDNNSCAITAFVSPIENNLCFDVPDLCWTTSISTVTRSTDYTCEQAMRGKEILTARGGAACVASTQLLTDSEIAQINDPKIYQVLTDKTDTSGAVPDPNTVLPSLKSIALDSSCRCHYLSDDTPTFIYKYPALELHCRSHFSEVYQ